MAQTSMSVVRPATRQIQWLLRRATTEQLATPPKKIKQKEPKPEEFFSAHKQHVIRCFNCQGSRREKIRKIKAILANLIEEVRLKCPQSKPSQHRLQIIKDFFEFLGLSVPEIQKNGAEQLYIFLEKK